MLGPQSGILYLSLKEGDCIKPPLNKTPNLVQPKRNYYFRLIFQLTKDANSEQPPLAVNEHTRFLVSEKREQNGKAK